MKINECPYLDGKCGRHAQCTDCSKRSAGAKSPRSKRDPYVTFLEIAFVIETEFIIIGMLCDMLFK